MTTPSAPRTLDEVERIADPVARARAAELYLDRLAERRTAAIRVRDAALRSAELPSTALARAVGVSVGTVKIARRAR